MSECNESYREILDQWRGPVGPGNRITVTVYDRVVTEDLAEEVAFGKCLGQAFHIFRKERCRTVRHHTQGQSWTLLWDSEGTRGRCLERRVVWGHSLLEGSWSRIMVRCSFICLPSVSYLSLVFMSCFFHSSFIFFNGFSWSFSSAL